ncbi:MAG: hypothetical protein IJC80_05590 [Clostridia bacterium]|nr:hypothetical protein [Clostridia bacterium]
MNRRELKNKIKEDFEKETPELYAKIEKTCNSTVQQEVAFEEKPRRTQWSFNLIMKRACALAVCLLIFVTGISVGIFAKRDSGGGGNVVAPETDAHVYLDVNPSVELSVNTENKVAGCSAINEDAEKILEGLNLENVDMNTALNAIIGAMYMGGYLSTDSNSILVSVEGKDDARADAVLTDVSDKISKMFEGSALECEIVAQKIVVDENLSKRAEENGVSVGKMHFVDKMVEEFDEISEESAKNLLNMTIGELGTMRKELEEHAKPPKDDEMPQSPDEKPNDEPNDSEKPNRVENDEKTNSLVEKVLASKEISADKVKSQEVYFWFASYEHHIRPAYIVILEIDGEAGYFVYDIDLFTGEIFKEQHVGSLEELWK